jgi:hypothetical protein
MEGEPGVLGWHGSQRALRSHWQFSAFQFSYLFDIALPLHAVITEAIYPVAFGQAATGFQFKLFTHGQAIEPR